MTHDGLTDQERLARIHRLLQHMIISMVVDAESKRPRRYGGETKTLHKIARTDLKNFRDWDIYVLARDCGLDFPNETQIGRYLDNGMADRNERVYVVTQKEDRVQK